MAYHHANRRGMGATSAAVVPQLCCRKRRTGRRAVHDQRRPSPLAQPGPAGIIEWTLTQRRTVLTNSDREILVCEDAEAVAREAARRFVAHSAAAIQQKGRFAVALSGGTTPKRLYELLSDDPYRERIDWSLVHFFWGDERFVPSTNQASNYHMTEVALLNTLELNDGNVHRVRTEMKSADAAAAAYEREIVAFFQPGPGEIPQFDLVLLGLGTNGHTASLFPHTHLLHENAHLVASEYIDEVKQSRISFTV